MKMRKEFEDLDLVSAMWIIASNDGNHMITYRGMYERLGLKDDKEVRLLVNKHRELFRPDSALHDLDKWKFSMCNGKNRPFWIRNMANEDDKLQAIHSLKTSDAFRSQFRVGSHSPRSAVEIISWGLDHIDRLRKIRMASREANAKSWQMWLVFSIGILNIVATVVGFLMKSSAPF